MDLKTCVVLAAVLALASCQTCGQGIISRNLAWLKPASQSSDWGGLYHADLAVDGHWNTALVQNSCSATEVEGSAWWSVDLGSSQTVAEVWITSNGDTGSMDRLSSFYVGVTDDSPASVTPSPSNYAICSQNSENVPQGARIRLVCANPLTGRYVIVQVAGSTQLLLCEVEVYADSYVFDNNLSLGQPAKQISDFNANYVAGNAVDGDWQPHLTSLEHCAQTSSAYEPYSWWSVDLGSSQPVGEVWITSQFSTLVFVSYFYIGVSELDQSAPYPYPPTYDVCFHHAGTHLPYGTRVPFICDTVWTGRYVIIQLDTTFYYLTLCEVEVYPATGGGSIPEPVEPTIEPTEPAQPDGPTTMTATCDEMMKVFFDGVEQTSAPDSELNDWKIASTFDVPAGTTEVAIECENTGGAGGILASFDNGLVTDPSWQCSTQCFDQGMTAAVSIGSNGLQWPMNTAIDSSAQWIWTLNYKYAGGSGDTKVFCKTTL